MTTKAKDGRETLQERLQARIDKHRDPRGNICLGTYNHWDSALDLEAIGSLDAAQAEIARLKEAKRVLEHNGFRRCDIAACNCNSWHFVGGFKARFDEIKQVVEDAGYSTNGRTLLDAVKHMAKDATPLPVAEDVVERITDPIERIIADALLGANVPFTSEKSGTHRLDFGLGDGVFVEVKQFYTARADSALQKNENVILIQGRRAAERFASLLRQPEATLPERKGIAPDPITGQGDARSLTPEEDRLMQLALLSASKPEAAPEYAEIYVGDGKFALVEWADFPKVKGYRWRLTTKGRSDNFYAQTWDEGVEPRRRVSMHRMIMELPDNLVCDHINGNGLDNRRSNLRAATPLQNAHNSKQAKNRTSKFKGVCLCKETGLWRAAIIINKKRTVLGRFGSEVEAAYAYDKAARSAQGSFARLNFPEVDHVNT